ncbi:acetyltransferase, partial [Yersinia pestis]
MTTTTPIRLLVRPITAGDNLAIANVIREVSAEFGLTADKGYTVSDPNLDHLYELYSQPRSAYWVIEVDGHIAGGGGVAPLLGGEADLCELQKMYFLPILRGKGLAKQLALQALAFARQQGFGRCYLETTASLTSA